MRYYAEVEDRVAQHLEVILANKRLIFATDLVYFVSCEYETRWAPYAVSAGGDLLVATSIHTPHQFSPFTNDMRIAIKYTLRANDHEFWSTYEKLAPPGTENKLGMFLDCVCQEMEQLFSVERTYVQMLFILVNIAKLGVFFHKRGTRDAPYMAVVFIEIILTRIAAYQPDWVIFQEMQAFAIHAVKWSKEQKSKGK